MSQQIYSTESQLEPHLLHELVSSLVSLESGLATMDCIKLLLLYSISAVWLVNEDFELSDCRLALVKSGISVPVPWLMDGGKEISSDLRLAV